MEQQKQKNIRFVFALIANNFYVASLYIFMGLLSLSLHSPNSIAPMTYLPSGVAVAALYYIGFSVTPGILAGTLALVLYQGSPLETSPQTVGFLIQASIGLVEALVAVFIYNLFRAYAQPQALSFPGLTVFLIGGACAATIGAALGAPSLWINGFIPAELIPLTLFNWALADLLGMMTIIPIVASYHSNGWRISADKYKEIGFIIIPVIILLYFYFTNTELMLPIFLFFFFVAWASVRFEGFFAPTLASSISCLIIIGEAQGLNHFKTQSHITNINLFCYALILSSLLIRILVKRLNQQMSLTYKLEIDQIEHQRRIEQLNRTMTVNGMGSSILHEINTPLQAISTRVFTGMQKNMTGKMSQEELSQLFEKVHASVNSIDLIQQKYKGYMSRNISPNGSVDIVIAAREAIGMLEPDISKENIIITNDIPLDLPLVQADAISVKQLFVNLLKNSVEAYAGKTGRPRTIHLSGYHGGRTVSISISDQAGGIPQDKQGSVFQPLVSGKPNGTGLGLAICQSITETCGGGISLTSDGTLETTFTFVLNQKQETLS